MTVLENPAWASLTGHARFAERHGKAVRYPVDVAPFLAVPPEPDAGAWADVAALAGPGALVGVAGGNTPPPGWETVDRIPGVQLVDNGVAAAEDGRAVRLSDADVPEMLALVALTRPAAGIKARGETPFLHAAASNASAIRLYESLGSRPSPASAGNETPPNSAFSGPAACSTLAQWTLCET